MTNPVVHEMTDDAVVADEQRHTRARTSDMPSPRPARDPKSHQDMVTIFGILPKTNP
jgi:hypothetical protein